MKFNITPFYTVAFFRREIVQVGSNPAFYPRIIQFTNHIFRQAYFSFFRPALKWNLAAHKAIYSVREKQ
jgi:hypothetical protein